MEENLLDDDAAAGGNKADIITHGERIAELLGKVKTINPNLLASQLNQLNLSFDDGIIQSLNNVSKCAAIEGVEVSQEELEALKEAANAQMDAIDESQAMSVGQPVGQTDMLVQDFADMKIGSVPEKKLPPPLKIQQPASMNQINPPNVMQKSPVIQQQPVVINQAQPVIQGMPPGQITGNLQMDVVDNMPPMGGEQQMPQNAEEDELDPEFLSEIETYLKECMENNELSIDMSDTLIKDHGAKMVAAAASLCESLQELRLQQCGITDEGAIELFNELIALQQLQVIDLSFNQISERSLEALTKLLQQNQNLVVNMRMNAIKNKFAARKMQHFEQQGRLNIQN